MVSLPRAITEPSGSHLEMYKSFQICVNFICQPCALVLSRGSKGGGEPGDGGGFDGGAWRALGEGEARSLGPVKVVRPFFPAGMMIAKAVYATLLPRRLAQVISVYGSPPPPSHLMSAVS